MPDSETAPAPAPATRPEPPEPPPYNPDDSLIGYIERGQKPADDERQR
jgi:hypothetical protein